MVAVELAVRLAASNRLMLVDHLPQMKCVGTLEGLVKEWENHHLWEEDELWLEQKIAHSLDSTLFSIHEVPGFQGESVKEFDH